MVNFSDYLGDFILKSGDREIRSKIWSPPDSLGELTAVTSVFKVLVHSQAKLEAFNGFLSRSRYHEINQISAFNESHYKFAQVNSSEKKITTSIKLQHHENRTCAYRIPSVNLILVI